MDKKNIYRSDDGPYVEVDDGHIKTRYVMSVYDVDGNIEDVIVGERPIKKYFREHGRSIQSKRSKRD